MAKPICLVKDPSGQEPKTYVYDGSRIEVLPYFLYEVCIIKYWKYGFCVLGSRFFKTDKLLHIKHKNVLKYYKDYTIEKEIFLVGAPYEFIRENNLPVYKPNVKKKKFKKNERAR